jgi:hypothetical protein
MATQSASSDKSIGFAMVFVVLGLLGAVGMLFFSLEGSLPESGWSFAVAMAAAAALVAGIHLAG